MVMKALHQAILLLAFLNWRTVYGHNKFYRNRLYYSASLYV